MTVATRTRPTLAIPLLASILRGVPSTSNTSGSVRCVLKHEPNLVISCGAMFARHSNHDNKDFSIRRLQAVIAIDFFNVLPLFELDLPLMVVSNELRRSFTHINTQAVLFL